MGAIRATPRWAIAGHSPRTFEIDNENLACSVRYSLTTRQRTPIPVHAATSTIFRNPVRFALSHSGKNYRQPRTTGSNGTSMTYR